MALYLKNVNFKILNCTLIHPNKLYTNSNHYGIIKDYRIRGITGEGEGRDAIFQNRDNSSLVLYHGAYGEATQKVS